jgi:hypothetical protein
MQHATLSPIVLDCSNLRNERQKINNLSTLNALIEANYELLKKISNEKEIERVLIELDTSMDTIFDKCKSDVIFAKTLAGRIAIMASRQGTKDEELQLNTCNLTTSKFGITIENLNATAYRPTKCGKIVNKQECKKYEKNDCLKSFDGKIDGRVKGWIFAKVVFGNGGHQDNVFEEAHTFCDWVCKFGNDGELYVVLIDTDLTSQFEELKKKYHKDNVLVVNHIDFQQYIIDRFSENLN